jgi:hypothetical protein
VARQDFPAKRHLLYSEIILKEAQPFLVGEPRTWARRFGQEVTFGETFGQMFRSSMPLRRGRLRIDTLVFHDLPTELGQLHAAQVYSGKVALSTEFLIVQEGRIPRGAFLKRRPLSEIWATAQGDERSKDEFCVFLGGQKEGEGGRGETLADKAKWSQYLGGKSLDLSWTMQLIPLEVERFLFVFKRPWSPDLFSVKKTRFHVGEAMEVAGWLKRAVAKFGYQGPPLSVEVPFATLSLVAIPELAERMPDQGAPLPWPATSAAPSRGKRPQSGAAVPRETKFCIACGHKIPGNAKFCPDCGGEQRSA